MGPIARRSFLNASLISSLPNEETTPAHMGPGSSSETFPILYHVASRPLVHLHGTCARMRTHACMSIVHVGCALTCIHVCAHAHACTHTRAHTHTPTGLCPHLCPLVGFADLWSKRQTELTYETPKVRAAPGARRSAESPVASPSCPPCAPSPVPWEGPPARPGQRRG